jgi:uncharacterized protein (TIGR02271 family)
MVTRTGPTTVVGLFHDSEDARDAIDALQDAGFRGDEIGLLMRDRDEARDMAAETGTRAGEGAATGAVAGGLLGGLTGWLVGIGALVIPGVGPFIAAGAFGAALTGAAVGAGVGAIAGAVVGMGIPKEEAEWYEGEVRGGRTLVTVRADGRYDEARAVLREYGAYDIQDRDAAGLAPVAPSYAAGTRWEDAAPRFRSRWQERFGTRGGRWEEFEPAYRYAWEMWREPRYRDRTFAEIEPELRRDWETRHRDRPWNRFSDAIRDAWESRPGGLRDRAEGGRTVQLREEELRATRRPVEAGEVELRKDVVSEQRTVDVPVTREEVVVERRPVDRRPSDRPITEGATIEVPVREERVEVEKQPVVFEEVEVGKRAVTDTERVTGTVRREDARLEREGDVNVREPGRSGMTTGTWDESMPTYRQMWERRYGTGGGRWEEYEPGYRYGYEMANDARYRDRQWTDVEPSLRTDYEDWARRHHYAYEPSAWERMKEGVREAWEGARARVGRY